MKIKSSQVLLGLSIVLVQLACNPTQKSMNEQDDVSLQSKTKKDTLTQEEANRKGLEHAVEEKLLPIYKEQIKENEKK